jgi:hypothetical protein
MAKTNAENQAGYRSRMRQRGYSARLIWVKKGLPTPKTGGFAQGVCFAALFAAQRYSPDIARAILEAAHIGRADALDALNARDMRALDSALAWGPP